MYVRCQHCSWTQDDYWDEGYNPIKSLQEWQEILLDFEKLEEPFPTEPGDPPRTYREVVAQECERAARKIREMAFLTLEEGRASNCPLCDGPLIED
jgi:hypothetical protein